MQQDNSDYGFVFEGSLQLQEQLLECGSEVEKREMLSKYLIDQSRLGETTCPDFRKGLEWFNVKHGLSLEKELKGKIVVLDFFTYCCINCLHILPDLEALERRFGDKDGVVVVGVHSAKFDNEKVSANILSAVLRYNINHAVVNDDEATLWHQLQIQCWPTLLILGPNAQPLLVLTGEGHRNLLIDFVELALEHYRSQLSAEPIGIKLSKKQLGESPLLFPGKIAVDSTGRKVAISDSGHNRIVITGTDGIVQRTIGGPSAGFRNGPLEEALFCCPQGLIWRNTCLFVADTENHSIRKIDFEKGEVTTVAGTGLQGHDMEGGKPGTEQEISSPWDLALVRSFDSSTDDVLLIAMAGTHQIWALFLEDGLWLKKVYHKAGSCVRFAGSGAEENRNNSYPHRAGFAQPSGICVSAYDENGGATLYVADSESSTIRSVSMKDGAVKALVGGSRDPTDLFAYGDTDGKAYDAKMQHPLAVALQQATDGPLLVADSYNHKIKMIDLKTKVCKRLVGNGLPGDQMTSDLEQVQLNEPGGLCMCEETQQLYICDTNNHAVKIYNVQNETLSKLPIIFPEKREMVPNGNKAKSKDIVDSPRPQKRLTSKATSITHLQPTTVCPGAELEIHIKVDLDRGLHLTEGAPSAWQLLLHDELLSSLIPKGQCLKEEFGHRTSAVVQLVIPTELHQDTVAVRVECKVYYCDDANACRVKDLVFNQIVHIDNGSEMKLKKIQLNVKIDA